MTDGVGAPVQNGARAAPAGLHTWGGGCEAGAPWGTRLQAATPNGSANRTPAIPRPRGVEDAAPYGRVINVGISIVVNSRVNTANLLPPLGSPERGAVAALCAVTEGLVQGGCGETTLPVSRGREGVKDKPLRCE